MCNLCRQTQVPLTTTDWERQLRQLRDQAYKPLEMPMYTHLEKIELLDGTLAKRMYPAVKVVIMDDLKVQYPEKFSGPTSVMDHKWFEADIRPKYNCFIRKDVGSVAFSFTTESAPLTPDQAKEALPTLYDLIK